MSLRSLIAPLFKALSVLLIAAILGSSLCSCGVIILNTPGGTTTEEAATTVFPETTDTEGTLPGPDGTDTGEETEGRAPETVSPPEPVQFPSESREDAQARLDALDTNIDISDVNMIVASAAETSNVIFPDEDSAFYISRMERNTMLHDKYGVDVLTLSTYETAPGIDLLYTDIAAALKAGDSATYYLDLLILPASGAGKFLSGGLLRDLRNLPFYDTAEGSMAGNVGAGRYFDLGAGTYTPEHLYAVYFNRTLLGEETSNSLFRAGLDGTLTFETLLAAAKNAEGTQADISSAGDISSFGELSAQLLGIQYITKSSTGVPRLALEDSDISLLDSLTETFAGFNKYVSAEGTPSATEVFISGKTPFYLGTLGDISVLYDKNVEWGLLPLPSEKMLGAFSKDRPVICLPKTNTRYEQTGIWLTAFNAASGDWITDHFRDTLIRDYMRDNNSCLTLADILERDAEIGFEMLYAGYYSGLADATYSAASSAATGAEKFSVLYKKHLSAVNKKLEKLP